jgi:phage gp29-like protein
MPRQRLYPLTAYPELRTNGVVDPAGNISVPTEAMKAALFGKPPINEQNRTRYGRSLTLDRIENALRNAQNGYMRDLTDMARETVSLDPHLGSVLTKRINAVASLDYEIREAEGPGVDKKLAKDYAEFVREQLLMIPRFKQRIKQLAWGLFDGRAALEIQWVQRSMTTAGGISGNWRAGDLAWIHPRRLQFGPERELRIADDAASYAFAPVGVALRDVANGYKFVQFTPQLFGDYPELEGLAPRCLYWSFFKRFGARERMILLELFGKPWRIVSVDEDSNAGEPDLLAAETIVDQLGGAQTARLPRGVNLDVVKTDPGSGQIHADVIAESDKQISKLVLGQTGTTDAMPGALGGGNQALVMKDEQLLLAQGDADLLGEAIEDGLTDSIIGINFGVEALLHAPRFVLKAEAPQDRAANTARLMQALNLGLSVSVDEAYEITGFRKPAGGEAIIKMVDMPNGMGGNQRVPAITVTQKELDEAGQAIEDANIAAGLDLPPVGAPAPTAPEPGAPAASDVPAIELGVSDLSTIFTVNEGRASQGAGPLMLPGGGKDPDGDLTIAEFRAKREAKQGIIGEGEGTAASPVPPTPAPAPVPPGGTPPAPGSAPPAGPGEPEGAKPPEAKPAVDPAVKAIADALGLADEEVAKASDALLSNCYAAMTGAAHVHTDECSHPNAAVKLSLERNRQPDTVYGTLETLIDKGVKEGARVTSKWADTFVAAVRGETNAAKIQRKLQQTFDRLDTGSFARTIERRLTHSAMTGTLDSQWEDLNEQGIAPEPFPEPEVTASRKAKLASDTKPSFTGMPYADALSYFKSKTPVPKTIFEKLSAAAKARSFTVAGLASEHALSIAQSELGNAIANGTSLKDFAAALATRFESAGFTALNPSHVETVFRTNLVSAYNVGRKAEMSQPDALKMRPYWVIRTVKDDRQRDTHGAVDGWVLRATDPFWKNTGGPPWGFNCRCRLSTIRESKLGDRTVRSGAEIRGLPDKDFEPGGL